MKSICCALISYVLFYIALNFKQKYSALKGLFALLSIVMIILAIILMIFGV